MGMIEQKIISMSDDELETTIAECKELAARPLSHHITRGDIEQTRAAKRILIKLEKDKERREQQRKT